MKKSSFRPIVWVILIAASISSYTYLHQASDCYYANSNSQQMEQEMEMEDVVNKSKPIMPDVALVKKLLNITKIVLPKD